MKIIFLKTQHNFTIKIMKKLYIYTILLLPFILTNCETILEDFDVNNSDPQLVIEATCNFDTDSAIVLLTNTANYMNPVEYPKISGASIQLEFDDTIINLVEIEKGKYVSTYNFASNKNYTIKIKADNNEYIAQSFLPEKVKIDSIRVIESPYSIFVATKPGQVFYQLLIYFTDPVEVENYYRLKISKNDTLFNESFDLMVFNDDIINGKSYELPLNNYLFEIEDTVKIELVSIDKANHDYYITLTEAMSSTGNFSVPDNPKTNFSPYALGHFIAFSSDTTTLIINP